MAKHALLSPSSAERWLECPASIRVSQKLPRGASSSYAEEGTAAHALGELKARHRFRLHRPLPSGAEAERLHQVELEQWREEYADAIGDNEDEMWEHTDAYVDLIAERLELHPSSTLLLEQSLPTGYPDGGEGTSDAVIVSPVHVEIIDFKYGKGVEVAAERNPQLRTYGYGALITYGDLLGYAETVRMTVHQPRLNHVLTEEITADELREWHAGVIPIAELALGPSAPFGPSATACRWCPASGRCPAQLEKATSTAFGDDPDLLSPDELADALDRVPLVKTWLDGLEVAALHAAYSEGVSIPRYKVVKSGGQRKISDPAPALDHLGSLGYSEDQITDVKVKGIGALEKLLGKDRFAEELAPWLTRTEGKPALVGEDDRREAIAPGTEAAAAFGDADAEELL